MFQQDTIKRFYLIFEKIKNRPFPSSKNILRYLENSTSEIKISKRTLERDLDVFRNKFGIKIIYDRPKDGYYIDESQSLNISDFSFFLEKINTADLIQQNFVSSMKYISLNSSNALIGIEYLEKLITAVSNHFKVTIMHLNYETKKVETITIEPYLLKEYKSRWYVVGQAQNETKRIGVDRIIEIKSSDDKFIFKDRLLVEIKTKFKSVIGIILPEKKAKLEKIILSFSEFQGLYIKSLPWHSSQKVIIDNAKEYRISLSVHVNYDLIQKILENIENLTVISPPSLKETVRKFLQEGLNKHDQ